MKQTLEDAFSHLIKEYDFIFDNYYPSHDSTGFMEVNQVHLFIKSLGYLKGDAFAWLEPPLKKVGIKYPHIDGVVFIPSEKSVVFIEAKRIDKPNKKVNEVYRDINRLLIEDNRKHIISKANFEIEKHFIVYLADLWLEGSHKESIPFWWTSKENHKDMNGVISKRYKEKKTFLESMALINVRWNPENQLIHRFKGTKDYPYLKNYCLMCGIHKI
ncbi:hypothetical protein CXF83_12160 [Shewanella sp. Choline-02u-19]|uniref:hypothetical protein n=1 Tax=unclassified Shewanella TaxID=196818 RepID=UPI000C338274|nr:MULTISPECIES: hypothetical protein [unclassified Shewanella]PKH55971.1 hypothetical protein CXF84_16070 [Shewanella sp. Bg11-22]PKI27417.1 hypothetical protein CXF83_12160 [Shewanella sp. Choline-02u-19]